jgi:hypothetical protein
MEHLHQRVNTVLGETEGAPELGIIQHMHVVGPSIPHHRLLHPFPIDELLELNHMKHLVHSLVIQKVMNPLRIHTDKANLKKCKQLRNISIY